MLTIYKDISHHGYVYGLVSAILPFQVITGMIDLTNNSIVIVFFICLN